MCPAGNRLSERFMRNIKFRFWCNRRKKFLCTDYVLGIEYCEGDFEDGVFQQYTGLKDKNETEIYEGDIIQELRLMDRTNSDGWWDVIDVGEVFWSRNHAAFLIDFQTHDDIDSMGSWSHRYEVLGNIFQNPELLQK